MFGYQCDYGFMFWVVIDGESGELFGDCGLILFEGVGFEVEFGYWFVSV